MVKFIKATDLGNSSEVVPAEVWAVGSRDTVQRVLRVSKDVQEHRDSEAHKEDDSFNPMAQIIGVLASRVED